MGYHNLHGPKITYTRHFDGPRGRKAVPPVPPISSTSGLSAEDSGPKGWRDLVDRPSFLAKVPQYAPPTWKTQAQKFRLTLLTPIGYNILVLGEVV